VLEKGLGRLNAYPTLVRKSLICRGGAERNSSVLQQTGRSAHAVDEFGPFAAHQDETGEACDGHLLKRVIFVPNVDVLAGRWPVEEDADAQRMQPDVGESRRLGVRQGFISSAWTTLNMAVLAPMPMASDRTTAALRPGLLRSMRRAYQKILQHGVHDASRVDRNMV